MSSGLKKRAPHAVAKNRMQASTAIRRRTQWHEVAQGISSVCKRFIRYFVARNRELNEAYLSSLRGDHFFHTSGDPKMR